MNLQIELTNHCNFNCVYCPRPFLRRPKTYIENEMLHKIINTFVDDTTGLILHKDGEPFLHPKFEELLTGATKKYKGVINIYTNGIFMSEKIIDFLGTLPNIIHLLVTEHIVGRDGIQNTELTKINTKRAIEKGYSNLFFHVTLHHVSDNIDPIAWKAEWDMFKKDYKNLLYVQVGTHINSWTGLIPTKAQPTKQCLFLESLDLFFGVTGNCLPCCVDLNEDLILGNIMTHTKEELLFNFTEFKARLKQNKYAEITTCINCIS